jgi:hypothetical protein
MLASASQLLGEIFVTKEVHVTTEHRFEDLGNSSDTFGELERGPTAEMEYSVPRAGSRLEWVGKDGVQQHCETWTR